MLIQNGFDIEAKTSNKSVFGTALHLAASLKEKDIFNYLIDIGANVNAVNSYNNSILFTCVMNYEDDDDAYYIKTLIEHGANMFQENDAGISPIALAHSIANYDVKKYFPPIGENNE
jgi:ankyrin repeat protein